MKTWLTIFVASMILVSGAETVSAQSLSINVYSQRDSRWSGHRMAPSSLTVGNYGCLMTSLAAAYRTNPDTLNAWLSRNGGYTSGGLLNHDVAARFDGFGGLRYVGRGSLPTTASSIGRGVSRGAVYVTASRRFAGSTHWVLVFGTSGNQAYYMDPWDGTIRLVGDSWVRYGSETRLYSFQ